jgi:hypothetical protein
VTLLFIDWDGVLHRMPRPGDPIGRHYARHFEFVDPLADVVLRFPEVRVVVSSSWRHSYPVDELRYMLGGMSSVVVGTTGRGNYGSRYEEIRAAAYKQGPWIAIDDDIEGWGEHDRERLVQCDPYQGLGEPGKLEEVADKLARAAEIHEAIVNEGAS